MKSGRKILFSLIVVTVFLAVIELGVRLYADFFLEIKPYSTEREIDDQTLVPDEKFGWKWKNGISFRSDAKITLNNPDGVFRIITAGDSCCYGVMVDNEKTFSSVLEKTIGEKIRNKKVEVLNSGVPGYNLRQVLLLIENKLVHFQPDIIILYGPSELSHRSGDPEAAFAITKIQNILFHSKAFLLLSNIIRSKLETSEMELPANYMKITAVNKMLENHDIRFLLVESAAWIKSENKLISSIGDQKIETDIPVVMTYDALIRSGKNPEELFLDNVHPSQQGHAIIAQQIYNKLENLGWLP